MAISVRIDAKLFPKGYQMKYYALNSIIQRINTLTKSAIIY